MKEILLTLLVVRLRSCSVLSADISGFEVLSRWPNPLLTCKLPEVCSFSASLRETLDTLVAVKVYDLKFIPSGAT